MKRPLLKEMACIALWVICLAAKAIGLSYDRLAHGQFTAVHVLIVDPKTHVLLPVKSLEGERSTVRSFCREYGAAAAVNGGFWKPDGRPAGILKIDSHWYGTPVKPRGAIGWSRDGQTVLIDRVLTSHSLSGPPPGESMEVLPASTPPSTTPCDWRNAIHIVGGTPVLINGGRLVEDYRPEQTLHSFLTCRHPRTAVGIRENGEWVFVVVDGRVHGIFGGMTIRQLAELMLSLGCVKALNLDGGGSSTMVLEGNVVNRPCGSLMEERKWVEAVSDAILIFSVEPPLRDFGTSDTLFIRPEL